MCTSLIFNQFSCCFLTLVYISTGKVLTAIRMEPIGELYSKWKAIEAMEAGYVCIFGAGTGCPYFSTDTVSSLRCI